jgi:hypothetical protein
MALPREDFSLDPRASPVERPLRPLSDEKLKAFLDRALAAGSGLAGAHAIHELWMRGEISLNIERDLAALWKKAADSIPEWLPMRYVERLADIYDISSRFTASGGGKSNIYLVLLDYSDSRDDAQGLYVGMSKYSPAQRFDQHKAGIRAAGSVLRRGLEVLTGPTLHLQFIKRSEAARVEEQLAEVLSAEGFFVQGGH